MKEGAQEYRSLFTGTLDPGKVVSTVQQKRLVAAEDCGDNSVLAKRT